MGKSVPLPIGTVVRVRDEDSGETTVFRRIMRDFSFWTRCAWRITGAHQDGVKRWEGRGLGSEQPNGDHHVNPMAFLIASSNA